jgi:hypothetical protein
MIDEFIAWADGHEEISDKLGHMATYTLVWRRGDTALFYNRIADAYRDVTEDTYKKIEFYREVVHLPNVTTGNGFCASVWYWHASLGEDYAPTVLGRIKLTDVARTPLEAAKRGF